MSRELEFKLTLSKRALERLVQKPQLRKLAIGPPKKRSLKSIYFDTPDHSLRNARASLRVRCDDDRWFQTMKVGTELEEGLSNPVEYESRFNQPVADPTHFEDKEARKVFCRIVDNKPLEPVFEISVWRSAQDLKVPDQGLLELAIDDGYIRAGDRSSTVREVEVELKSGQPYALLTACEQLFGDDVVNVSKYSKAERGYRLLAGETCQSGKQPKPKKFVPPVVSEKLSPQDVLSRTGRAAADQILNNWQVVERSVDPEGPHQLRVGLRRLRTALRLFKPITAGTELERVISDARDMARSVGRLRDADVLIIDICAPAAKHLVPSNSTGALRDALDAHLERERRHLREELNSPRWSYLKLNCILFEQALARAHDGAEMSDRHKDVASVAGKALKRSWRRVRKWGRRISDLSVVERHEMRKDLKTLRYATEYFLPFYEYESSSAFLKQLKSLQKIFGYLNDVATAHQLSANIQVDEAERDAAQREIKAICDWHEQRACRAWESAQKRWNDLATQKRFWT